MATTTGQRLRELLARASGFYVESASTGAGTTTTTLDAGIVKYNTSILANKWLLARSGDNSGVARRISSVSSTTITHTAFANAMASGVTYEILPFDPVMYDDALQQACRTVYPTLWLPIRDEIIVDNLLANSSMETAGANPPVIASWTASGSPTVTQDTTHVRHSTYGAKIVAGASIGRIGQNIFATINIPEQGTKDLHLEGWVWCAAASTARISVTFDGSAYSGTSYHSGDSQWERLSADIDISTSATQITVNCEVAASGTAWFDLVWAAVDPIYEYTLPTTLIDGPHMVYQQTNVLEPEGQFEPLGLYNPPTEGRLLRALGMGRLTVPTSDTATVELDENRAELVVAIAANNLFTALANAEPGNRAGHLENAGLWEGRAAKLRRQPGIRMVGMPADTRDEWSVMEDVNGRFLILERGTL